MHSEPPLRKALGQHHLRSAELCRPALDFLDPRGRIVVEIGPGGGVLTSALLSAGARVFAWELDLAWAFELRRQRREAALAVVAADALDMPWAQLPTGALAAGNLPYSVASPLIESYLVHATGMPRAVFLVQAEVAERLVAPPGSRNYGLLSVMVAAHAEARLLARVKPGSFRPPPRVSGAFVGLTRRTGVLAPDQMAAFRRTLVAAFSYRRKTLLNAVGTSWGRGATGEILADAALDPSRRAESLSLDELLRLHRARTAYGIGGLRDSAEARARGQNIKKSI